MTEAEELLLCGLKFFPIRTGRLMLVMTLMSTEEKRWEMMRFLAKNQQASEDDILDEAYPEEYTSEEKTKKPVNP